MTEAPIEDRAENIKATVQHIILRKTDEMFSEFDRLHRRNIHDNDMVEALRSLGEEDLLDQYAEWAEIDLREGGDESDVVPDPASDESYKEHPLNQPEPNGIRVTGSVQIGNTDLHFGRDELGGQWIRPAGGLWVGVVEK